MDRNKPLFPPTVLIRPRTLTMVEVVPSSILDGGILLDGEVMNYKLVGAVESYGKYPIGVKIEISCPHTISEKDSRIISRAVDDIRLRLYKSAEIADPEVVKDIANEKEQLLKLFPADCGYKEIPNGYDSSSNYPWLTVYTTRGPIEIGWRKRVISIDWKDTIIEKTAHELFPDENVTKGIMDIHAWGYDKSREYIAKILA